MCIRIRCKIWNIANLDLNSEYSLKSGFKYALQYGLQNPSGITFGKTPVNVFSIESAMDPVQKAVKISYVCMLLHIIFYACASNLHV